MRPKVNLISHLIFLSSISRFAISSLFCHYRSLVTRPETKNMTFLIPNVLVWYLFSQLRLTSFIASKLGV